MDTVNNFFTNTHYFVSVSTLEKVLLQFPTCMRFFTPCFPCALNFCPVTDMVKSVLEYILKKHNFSKKQQKIKIITVLYRPQHLG